jgi:6-phosphofructokinase 1
MLEASDLLVKTLGPCKIESPLGALLSQRNVTVHYVEESDRVLYDDTVSALVARGQRAEDLPAFEPAGPRRRLFFDPSKTRVGIVTCGGLCPGLNDVIRAITLELIQRYGVPKVWGFCNGYQGFIASYCREVIDLTPQFVTDLNEHGGTILGSSRGAQDPVAIVDCLERMGINVLIVIGGDGTLRGASALVKEITDRGAKIAVVGVPKTIDNDISLIDQSFGFQTAFSEATQSIRSAHVEAIGAPNGVGLVKLMGRHSGFIACYAALAMSDANFVLIPEVPFFLDGDCGFLNVLRKRIERRRHAVIVVAEGAGQHLVEAEAGKTDASGNKKLVDIGPWLKKRIEDYFSAIPMEINLKYIDPSYQIRSVPANPHDSALCVRLAHKAVHAAMSGRTDMVVGRWHGRFVHVPIAAAIKQRNTVDPDGDLWMSVLESTGQPKQFK